MQTRQTNPFDASLRLWIFRVGVWIAFFTLVVALWSIQMRHGEKFETAGEQQSLRRVRIPALRGKIYDRNGVCLADNAPSYSLVVYLEEVAARQKKRRGVVKEVINIVSNLSQQLHYDFIISENKIIDHIATRKPLPLTIAYGLTPEIIGRFSEISEEFPFMEIIYEAERVYPKQTLAAHVLGYIRKDSLSDHKTEKDAYGDNEDEDFYHYYLPDMIGMSGIEKAFDWWLTGKPGGKLMRVNVSGFKYDDISLRQSESGGDIVLSIDAKIQDVVEKALSNVVGAAVVVDVNTGDILAMASAPSFNPNDFYPAISLKLWQSIQQNKDAPLLNKAISASYPPGSTFKPIVALAALESGKASAETILNCHGHFYLGNHKFSCYMNIAHGDINMFEALKHSCNVYFYQLGLLTGYQSILDEAAQFGLGKITGIDLPYEIGGLLPSKEWKRRNFNDNWRDGDTCNLSVGQGFLLVTPLQMAILTAAIANGGKLLKPRLVLARKRHNDENYTIIPPTVVREISVTPFNINTVKKGMLMVIQEPDGTGRYAKINEVTAAGKTGTAEYGKKGEGLKYGWMIVFAPYDKPKYAMAMVVDKAVSGGSTVAPRIREILQYLFGNSYTGEES